MMKMYFKKTNTVHPEQWIIAELDVTKEFVSEEYCQEYNAIEITKSEYKALKKELDHTGKILKEQ